MDNPWLKRALLATLITASAALGGCYYPYGPYGYGPRYGYAPPPPAYYHPYYYR